jgi:High potential iron-sulfur protein
MAIVPNLSRRSMLRRCALAAALLPVFAWPARAAWAAAAAPDLSESDPAAKQLKYVTDAKRAVGVQAGSTCANCALYQGAYGSAAGPCQIFPAKQVKAAGWCSSWAPQM